MRLIDSLKKHWRLTIILLIYTAIAGAHSVIAPLSIGNDEWAHFLYTRFIAEHGRLPINLAERQNKDEAGTKSDDPPLYHLLVAATASGLEPTRLLRPVNDDPRRKLADNFVVSYAFLIHNAYESTPYHGEVLLWHIGRWLSILFGAVIIVLTYMTSLELFPSRPKRASVAAALIAFIPAFIFHNSVMTYDGLGAVFTALFLLVAIKAIKQPTSWRWWIVLGTLGSLAVTTKYTSVLLPLEIIFIAWLAFQKTNPFVHNTVPPLRITHPCPEQSRRDASRITPHLSQFISRVMIAGLIMILITSWWFGFVVWHFNTIDTQGPIVGVLEPLMVRGGNDSTAITVTSWLFGEEAVSTGSTGPARERNYLQLIQIMIESFWSMPIAEQFLLSPWLALIFTLPTLLGIVGVGRIWQRSTLKQRTLLLLLLFHTLLVAPLILMRVFISFDPLEAVQGRHLLFPAASAIPILLVWGWSQWRYKISQTVVVGLLLWSIVGQLGWAAIVYPAPLPLWTAAHPGETGKNFKPINENLDEALQLIGVSGLTNVSGQEIPVASNLEVNLWWQSSAIMLQDYLVELTLIDQAGHPVSYSLSHPVQGRYPTRAWEPGDVVKDVHWLPLVGQFEGTYHLQARLLNQEGQPLPNDKAVSLGQVTLTASGQQDNECAIWFQGHPNYGGPLTQPYRLRSTFTVIGPKSPKLVPSTNQPVSQEQLPLISIGNFHVFMVGPDWGETYELFVGNNKCHNIAVSLPPRDFIPPEIPSPLVANFNNEVQLLGYDLPTRRIAPGERLPLTLYWQALTYIGKDYQIFDNLLDSHQQRWGGYDRRAKDGYSTLLWTPGEIITDRFGVPIDPEAPHGIYTLDIGLYRKTEQAAQSLSLFTEGQPTEQTSLRLGPIKVGGPPPEIIVDNPAPQTTLNQLFGNQITLTGYDLTDEHGNSIQNPKPVLSKAEVSKIQNLKLTLYWQAKTIPATDYTIFLHLRTKANETVAQKDQPPTNGQYPTSLWDAGDMIIDEIILPLENLPSGEYTPVIGLYDFTTGVRLPITNSTETELHLESVTLP